MARALTLGTPPRGCGSSTPSRTMRSLPPRSLTRILPSSRNIRPNGAVRALVITVTLILCCSAVSKMKGPSPQRRARKTRIVLPCPCKSAGKIAATEITAPNRRRFIDTLYALALRANGRVPGTFACSPYEPPSTSASQTFAIESVSTAWWRAASRSWPIGRRKSYSYGAPVVPHPPVPPHDGNRRLRCPLERHTMLYSKDLNTRLPLSRWAAGSTGYALPAKRGLASNRRQASE